MNKLEEAISLAISAEGRKNEANKAYLEFIKANFMIPIEKKLNGSEPEVLYLLENDQAFLPVFTDRMYFDQWAKDIAQRIDLLALSGVDLLKGIGEEVTICLNIGAPFYKEFNSGELARMRSMVLKIFK